MKNDEKYVIIQVKLIINIFEVYTIWICREELNSLMETCYKFSKRKHILKIIKFQLNKFSQNLPLCRDSALSEFPPVFKLPDTQENMW